MSLIKPRTRTPASLAANRANAKKSTGPRSPEGKRRSSQNAFRHGRYARPLWQAMPILGEDPQRFKYLLEDVVRSYPPRNPLQLRLCENITRLLLERERIQRAQEARLVRISEKLRMERERHHQQIVSRQSYDALQAEVLETGLRRAPESAAKFAETLACLERLLARVEKCDFTDTLELNALYGKNPTLRGAGIINAFRTLAQTPPGQPLDSDLQHGLRIMLLEEARDVEQDYLYYYREHIEVSRAMLAECLAPTSDPVYLKLKREEASVTRQFESTLKLLVNLEAAGAAQEADEPLGFLQEPLGWLESPASLLPAGPKPANSDPAAAASPSEGPLPPPAQASEAAGIALRHKVEPTRRPVSDRERQEMSKETIKRIQSIYGLNPEDEKNR